MEILNCLIIEDQIPAQETLKSFIEQIPQLSLLNSYVSPLEALEILESGQVDILFLDIHLPKLSGIELLQSLKSPPQTIITTAFSEYALDGFELDVVDYLLKPFSFQRFLKSISKIQKDKELSNTASKQDHLFVRNKGQIKKITLSTIKFMEAKGDFIIIYTISGREIANISLQKILRSLGANFVRCHKSYIVNINHIEKIIGNHIVIMDKDIPIGRTYKEALLGKIRLIWYEYKWREVNS